MTKKLLLSLMFCFAFITMSAQTPQNSTIITFIKEYVGNGSLLPSGPKTPTVTPEVSIDGYILYFIGSHQDYVLTLTDQDDNVVYMTNVFATDTQIALPTSLSGTFEVRLYIDIYCFVGEITL